MANNSKQQYNFLDMSGGVNNSVSDFLILDNQCTKLENLVTVGNKLSVIKGFSKLFQVE